MYEDFICLLGSAFLTFLPFTFLFAVWLERVVVDQTLSSVSVNSSPITVF
jgi:branched-subunit amino acid transport protein